jgi:shikimate kinase
MLFLPEFFMGQGLYDFRLFRWKLGKPPYSAIHHATQNQHDKQKPQAIWHVELPITTTLQANHPNNHPIKSLGAQPLAVLKVASSKGIEVMARRSLSKEIQDIREKLGNHPIVLVGLMGAGKSSIGRRLAEKLDLAFVDADHEIELAADKTIPEIFADHGEAYFREGERRVISRLIENGAQVLATGGGAFINDETRASIAAHGISIWLKADLSLLMKRVMKRADRPLLQADDPQSVMQQLMDKRYPIYEKADVTVESKDVQHTQMVNEVIKVLAKWPGWERMNHASS